MNIKEITKELIVLLLTFSILVSFFLVTSYLIPGADIKNHITFFILTMVMFTAIIYGLYTAKNYIKMGFLFEVTPNKQRCSIGYNGLPHLNFQYVPDYDRMSMPYCNDVNSYNQAKLLKTPRDEAVKDDQLILQNAFLY